MTVKDQLKALLNFLHGMTHSDRKRFILSLDDGMCCHYCREKLDYIRASSDLRPTYDHKTPLSKGGADDPENIVVACHGCNKRKGNMGYDEFRFIAAPVHHNDALIQTIHEQAVKIAELEHVVEFEKSQKRAINSWASRRILELSTQLDRTEAKTKKDIKHLQSMEEEPFNPVLSNGRDFAFNDQGGIVYT